MNGIIHTWIVSCTFQKWVLTDSFISSVKQDALSIVMSIPTYDFFHFETFFPLVVYLCYSQIPLRQLQLLSVSDLHWCCGLDSLACKTIIAC